MPELLIELLSEEIPARMQGRAAADLTRLICGRLDDAGLDYGTARSFATPRRLALVIDDLHAAQPDIREERRGPRVGAPDQAIDGFLRSVGQTRAQLEERELGKGRFHVAIVAQDGRPTADLLGEIVPDVIARFPWPKSMRWGTGKLRWVRPLHNVLCAFDGAPVGLDLGDGITSNVTTQGHRFMAPDVIDIVDFADYERKLRDNYVVLDGAERRAQIVARATELAARSALALVDDPALLDELAGLVEWPEPLIGSMDTAFMELPPEVLTTAMRSHQKFIALRDSTGKLAPRFVLVANLAAPDGGEAIVAGNERVLRARLHDAKFFWDQDRKTTLAARAGRLSEIVFHARLGTIADKARRMIALSTKIAELVPGTDIAAAQRAAQLCKADLLTDMVYEFPELQGIMGRYYARHDGEPAAVADAIAEHYSPLGPNDDCPRAPASVAVALADKVDTLAGFWAVEEKPTGSKDPFALRRAALGIVRLMLENRLRIGLLGLFHKALGGIEVVAQDGSKTALADDVISARADDLLAFFADRLKVHMRESGLRHDLVTAVLGAGRDDDLVRVVDRANALKDFLDTDDGRNLLAAHKRASNIVRIETKKDKTSYRDPVDEGLLEQAEERQLSRDLARVGETIAAALSTENYSDAMTALAQLRAPVDAFFDHVTVNCEDPEVRRNRLRLLSQIPRALSAVADFSLVEG